MDSCVLQKPLNTQTKSYVLKANCTIVLEVGRATARKLAHIFFNKIKISLNSFYIGVFKYTSTTLCT